MNRRNDVFSAVPQLSRGRKIDEWANAPSVEFDEVGTYAQEVLQDLPMFEAPLSLGAPTESASFYEGKRFFILTIEKDHYLVDTEGYDYARYILKINDLF